MHLQTHCEHGVVVLDGAVSEVDRTQVDNVADVTSEHKLDQELAQESIHLRNEYTDLRLLVLEQAVKLVQDRQDELQKQQSDLGQWLGEFLVDASDASRSLHLVVTLEVAHQCGKLVQDSVDDSLER